MTPKIEAIKSISGTPFNGSTFPTNYLHGPRCAEHLFVFEKEKRSHRADAQGQGRVLTEKYGRQIFAKVSGVFVYDMGGTANQVNI